MPIYYVGYKTRADPDSRLRPAHAEPRELGLAPAGPLVDAVDPVHRFLLARAARLDPRRQGRGLRAHRACQGPVRAQGVDPAHPAHEHAADHLAVGARHRSGDRRRRDPDRDRLRPARSRPARSELDRKLRHGHAAVDRDDHGARRRDHERGDRHPLRRARPEDQAVMTRPAALIDDLKVSFDTDEGLVRAVDGVSFTVDRGEVVAVVGESGSGKSVTGMTLMGLTRGPNAEISGSASSTGRSS